MKFLKEPLLHFVLLGGLIFAFYQAFDPEAREPGETELRVSPGRIMQLSEIFKKTWQRPPTKDELQGLVDDFVLEEIYYREATTAGLDQDDTLIRRRLRQKMEFLRDDMAIGTPTDEQLTEFVQEHPDRFHNPATFTFRQIFFNPDKLEDDGDKIIEAAKTALAEGKEPESHATLLPAAMEETTPGQIAGTFGESFAEELAKLETGKWNGPIRSGFGIHFIRVDDKQESTQPPLDEIRAVAQREWEHEERKAFQKRVEKQLLDKYQVTVEWPKDETPEG